MEQAQCEAVRARCCGLGWLNRLAVIKHFDSHSSVSFSFLLPWEWVFLG